MGRKSFCMFFRGIELATEVFGTSSPIHFKSTQMKIIIDTDKAKRALDHLHAERQVQHDRLQLAAYRKQELERNVSKSQLLK